VWKLLSEVNGIKMKDNDCGGRIL